MTVCVCVRAQRELLLPIMHHLRKHDPQCLKLSILNARWWYSNYITTTTTTWKIWRKDLTSEVKHTHKPQPEIPVCFVCDDVQLAGVLSVMERKKKKKPRAFEVWSVFERLSPKADGPKLETEEILSSAPAELLTTRLLLEVKVHRRDARSFCLCSGWICRMLESRLKKQIKVLFHQNHLGLLTWRNHRRIAIIVTPPAHDALWATRLFNDVIRLTPQVRSADRECN